MHTHHCTAAERSLLCSPCPPPIHTLSCHVQLARCVLLISLSLCCCFIISICIVKSFSVPRSVTYRERFQTNLNYYLGNYLAVLMLSLLLVCISIPSFILCLGVICAAYYYLFLIRTTALQIAGRTVRKNELIAAYLSGNCTHAHTRLLCCCTINSLLPAKIFACLSHCVCC